MRKLRSRGEMFASSYTVGRWEFHNWNTLFRSSEDSFKRQDALEEGNWDGQGSYMDVLKTLGVFGQQGRKHIKWSKNHLQISEELPHQSVRRFSLYNGRGYD